MGIMKKVLATTFATALVIGTFSGCGKETASIADDATPTSSAIDAKTVFTKGVYVTYPEAEKDDPDLTQFYVFFGDGSGSIEDGANGTANYFEYEAGEDTIEFHIGSIDPVVDTLTVTYFEDYLIKGHFSDGEELVFEHLSGVDVDTFNAVNYVNGIFGDPSVYTDANGWSIKYDASCITVNQGGPVTTFVYTGDCAGTNMITATYTVDNDAEGAVKELGEQWGEKATYSEGTFPGTEDIKGYCCYVCA
ncbi:MAG: hypothetical protein J5901_01545 [Pseudobutyrivibrio sp.]|nr:hypothetical protein [Pseudobutyrivibrio sp.]